MKKLLAVLLSAAIIILSFCTVFGLVASAESVTVSYAFSGSNQADYGFAEGTVTVTAGASDGGTYYLYWADDSKALDGFYPIATLSVSNGGSARFTMPAYTAIPAGATKVIAFKNSDPQNKTVSSAAAKYEIPQNKQFGRTPDQKLYSFASYSDTHIEADNAIPYNGYSAKYPYDEVHLTSAFNAAAARNVDFIVTTGDHVNNQRNDKNGGNNNLYAEEWNRYLKLLAESNYANPIYEAIGNHELWNYETDSNKTPRDWKSGSRYFVAVTGLDSTAAAVNSDKAYYEITEPVTGDHFLFMALEGGFYTDANNEFSDAQLNWLEQKLNAYQNDGKNTFILEHANFYKWGAGDLLNDPVYDIPLKDGNAATVRLKNILKAHQKAVIITGHTHFKYSLQLNYSDNAKTSAIMIHNSSVGGVRDINYNKTGEDRRINDKSKDQTEGYFVEVYDKGTIFYGANLYYNMVTPAFTYIVPHTTSAIAQPTEPQTEPPTQKPTEKTTEKPTQPKTEPPTELETERPVMLGDVDLDNDITILDATEIQRHLAHLTYLTLEQQRNAMVCGDEDFSILDATEIQRYLAKLIKKFPAEDMAGTGREPYEYEADSAYVEVGAEQDVAEAEAQLELEPAGADLNTLRSQANTALTKYWQLASYNQYLALKKAYRTNADYNTLNAAYNDFNNALKTFYPGDNITVRFQAPSGWGNVNAYVYNSGTDQMQAWPGKACTKSGSEWTITVPNGRYNYIIFNSGSNQTNDLALGITGNQGYRTFNSGGKTNGLPYQY